MTCCCIFILADLTADHYTTQSPFPHKLAPLKPAPPRASVRGTGDSFGSNPSLTVLGSVQRYQHVVQFEHSTSPDSGNKANTNLLNLEGAPYSHPVSLRLEGLEPSGNPFPDFSGLGNPDHNAQNIPPSDLTRSLPTSAFSSGRQPPARRTVSFDLSTTGPDVLAKSDGAVYLSSSG